MKKIMFTFIIALSVMMFLPSKAICQAANETVVNVQLMKMKWPEGGSIAARDSLIAIYNDMVIKKNEYILSHREYRHFYTASNKDYLVIQEYKDLASMEKAAGRSDELEKLAWPDEMKAKAFFEALDVYFENWHGDALYHCNPRLSKN